MTVNDSVAHAVLFAILSRGMMQFAHPQVKAFMDGQRSHGTRHTHTPLTEDEKQAGWQV